MVRDNRLILLDCNHVTTVTAFFDKITHIFFSHIFLFVNAEVKIKRTILIFSSDSNDSGDK